MGLDLRYRVGHMAALNKNNMKLSASVCCDSARCKSGIPNLPSGLDYSLLILEKDGSYGFFFFITCSSKGQNNFKQGQAWHCNKNAAISLCSKSGKGREKCHVCLSGKGTLIKRLRARGALNLLSYFSCICMKWCL